MGPAGARADSIIGARLAAVLGCLVFTLGCAHRAGAASPQIEHSGKFHIVKPGETLYRIARSYDVSVAALVRENGLSDAAHLSAGARLFIPSAAGPAALSPGRSAPRAAPPRRVALARTKPEPRGRKPEAALAWPVDGVLFSPFGSRARDQHDGIDLAAPQGTPVHAADGGTVLFVGTQRGYGNLILLGHPGDLVTVYAHNEKNLVRVGDRIARGDVIARVGRSGTATGPHLHFEVRVAAHPRDPMLYLR